MLLGCIEKLYRDSLQVQVQKVQIAIFALFCFSTGLWLFAGNRTHQLGEESFLATQLTTQPT